MLITFFLLTKPASNVEKPRCMINTMTVAIKIQRLLMVKLLLVAAAERVSIFSVYNKMFISKFALVD